MKKEYYGKQNFIRGISETLSSLIHLVSLVLNEHRRNVGARPEAIELLKETEGI